MSRTVAARRYQVRTIWLALLYAAALLGAVYAFKHQLVDGPAAWIVAVLPAFPLSAVFWIIGRYLIDLRDEYRRMLEVRKALVATGFAMTLATGWGFLEVYAHVPHVPLFFVPIEWFAGLGLGSAVNAVIERRGEDAA